MFRWSIYKMWDRDRIKFVKSFVGTYAAAIAECARLREEDGDYDTTYHFE